MLDAHKTGGQGQGLALQWSCTDGPAASLSCAIERFALDGTGVVLAARAAAPVKVVERDLRSRAHLKLPAALFRNCGGEEPGDVPFGNLHA